MSVFFELQSVKSRVHPAAVLTVLDAATRDERPFAITALLGVVNQEGRAGPVTVDVIDCFAVPYQLSEETNLLTIPSIEATVQLRQRIFLRTQLVGWAISSAEVSHVERLTTWAEKAAPSFFTPSKSLPSPLIMTVDLQLSKDRPMIGMMIRAAFHQLYRRVPMSVEVDPLDVPCLTAIARASSAHTSNSARGANLQDSVHSVRSSLTSLLSMLRPCQDYLKKVSRGELEGDSAVGREIARALCEDSLLNRAEVTAACEVSVRDTMYVASLANAAKARACAGEQLAAHFV